MEKIVELKNVSKAYKIVAYITNQFLAKKIKKIDMVSSLKGNE